jgi:hypothetical protein
MRLNPRVFASICRRAERAMPGTSLVLDLMASDASAQRAPGGARLPFVSRYHTAHELAVDIMAHSVAGLTRTVADHASAAAYCFPPAPMRLAVVSHCADSSARVLFILPQADDGCQHLIAAHLLYEEALALPRGQRLFSVLRSDGSTRHTDAGPQGWRACLCQF